MNKKQMLIPVVILSLVLVLAGCGGSGGSSAPSSEAPAPAPASSEAPSSESAPAPESSAAEEPVTIMVAAAASLEKSYTGALIPMFREKYPHITVEGTYDSSGKLQTQIEEGLAADVFMSAAMSQMNNLKDQSLVDADSIVQLLENKLVLVAPIDSTTDIASFEDAVKADTVAIGDPESVPAGQYAKEALTNLGVYDTIEAKASLGTNVTEVVNWVAEGSADIGFVYATDAASNADKVKILAEAPEGSLTTKVIYPVGIVAASEHKDAAQLFVDFLKSPEAIAVFESYGFVANK